MNSLNVKTFEVTSGDGRMRLDKFLTAKLASQSRTKIQKSIEQGSVLVNGRRVSKHHWLKTGDVIEINDFPQAQEQAEADRTVPVLKPEIIAVDKHYLIVDKPSGLVVHPDGAHALSQTLVGLLLPDYPELIGVGEDPNRPGIVHRLDKNVSGVMIVARSQEMFASLKHQFKTGQVRKEYLALVHGRVVKDNDVIRFKIGRKTSGYMAARSANQTGHAAITDFRVMKRFNSLTLLAVHPRTGRTHQLKAHLLAYGHPLVGELVYMSKHHAKASVNTRVSRPFLHSYMVSFYDLNGHQPQFTAELPRELKDFIERSKFTMTTRI